jgi:hypothetical protein
LESRAGHSGLREAELWVYGLIFDFEPADAIEPVQIDNWPAAGTAGA